MVVRLVTSCGRHVEGKKEIHMHSSGIISFVSLKYPQESRVWGRFLIVLILFFIREPAKASFKLL